VSKRNAITRVALVAASILGGGEGIAHAYETLPFEPDPGAIGSLVFYDASGNVITGGNLADMPFVAYAAATGPGPLGATKATIAAYTPRTPDPADWSGSFLSTSTNYPNASAPAAIAMLTFPVVTGAPGGPTLLDHTVAYPNTMTTPGFAGIYQVRLSASGPAVPANFQDGYYRADLRVTGDTWSVACCGFTSIALGAMPLTKVLVGETVTLQAAVTPIGSAGTVRFMLGALGAPPLPGVTYDPATGLATVAYTPTYEGDVSFVAEFLTNDPTSSNSFATIPFNFYRIRTPTSVALSVDPPSGTSSGPEGVLPVTLTGTALVTPPDAPSTPAHGLLHFFDGKKELGYVGTIGDTGVGKLSVGLTAGAPHPLEVTFEPSDANTYAKSTSAVLSFVAGPNSGTPSSGGGGGDAGAAEGTGGGEGSGALPSGSSSDPSADDPSYTRPHAGCACTQTPSSSTGPYAIAVGLVALGVALRRRRLSVFSVTLASTLLFGTRAASASEQLPIEPDDGAIGSLVFYDASGNVITGGNVDDRPLAAYVAATNAASPLHSYASLAAFTPNVGPPESWTGGLIGAFAAYPNAAAPSNVAALPVPVWSGSATATAISGYMSQLPNTETAPGYAGLYQLRLVTTPSPTGQDYRRGYYRADIRVTGKTWSVVCCGSTALALDATPPTTTKIGTAATFNAHVTPLGSPGVVRFVLGPTPYGQPLPGAAYDPASGLATVAYTAPFPNDGVVTAFFLNSDKTTTGSAMSIPYSFFRGAVTATTTVLTTSPPSGTPGDANGQLPVDLTAAAPGAGAGQVRFLDDDRTLGTVRVDPAGTARLSVRLGTNVPVHPLTAAFQPDDTNDFGPSTSAVVSFSVGKPGGPAGGPAPAPPPPPPSADDSGSSGSGCGLAGRAGAEGGALLVAAALVAIGRRRRAER
jgi:MYXO-CTERM domain-containing protein